METIVGKSVRQFYYETRVVDDDADLEPLKAHAESELRKQGCNGGWKHQTRTMIEGLYGSTWTGTLLYSTGHILETNADGSIKDYRATDSADEPPGRKPPSSSG